MDALPLTQVQQNVACRQRGITLLELMVIVCVVSIIGFVALGFYHKLLVDVERTTLEHNIGVFQSAIAMKFAELYVAGDKEGLAQLEHNNPVTLLEQPPAKYLGELESPALDTLSTGSWHFDTATKRLVYLVNNKDYFITELPGVPRAEFFLTQTGGGNKVSVSVPILEPVATYHWRRPWK